jgi:hypothetical protein
VGCDECGGEAPICVDGVSCAAECPAGRDVCHTDADPSAPGACCPSGTQCCEAQIFGYAGADVCHPEGEACPVGCPGSDVACPLYQYCQMDSASGQVGCVEECSAVARCGTNLCCPTGSQCVEGECQISDLTVDAGVLGETLSFSQVDAAQDPCLIEEECLNGPGMRVVLNFSTRTLNVGNADFVIGDPTGNPDFEYDQCHMHYHYHEYADYRLLDPSGNLVVAGKKQGFAIIDMGPIDPSVPGTPTEPRFDSAFQGIQRGWYDEYSSGIPCQWIDITGVPAGDYTLEVEVNPERKIAESNYQNNVAVVPVTIPDTPCLAVDCSYLDSECTEGVCDPAMGCVEMPTNEGGLCEDGLFCTTGETCMAGACGGGGPLACAPLNGCNESTCDEATDTCVSAPVNDGQPCDDGNVCTDGTTCANGACEGGAPVNEGAACDDDSSCTSNTVCTAGVCGGGTGPVVYFAEDFANNAQGWNLGPEWQIGPAVATTGADVDGNDPAQDHTATFDNGVAGVQIGGFAEKLVHGFYYLESPPFDAASPQGPVILGFYRWLNSDFVPYMVNTVDVWNGTAWINVWTSDSAVLDAPPNGPGWNYQQFDITSYANAGTRVRFGFLVGSVNGLYTIGSWNLDDVLVASMACP